MSTKIRVEEYQISWFKEQGYNIVTEHYAVQNSEPRQHKRTDYKGRVSPSAPMMLCPNYTEHLDKLPTKQREMAIAAVEILTTTPMMRRSHLVEVLKERNRGEMGAENSISSGISKMMDLGILTPCT